MFKKGPFRCRPQLRKESLRWGTMSGLGCHNSWIERMGSYWQLGHEARTGTLQSLVRYRIDPQPRGIWAKTITVPSEPKKCLGMSEAEGDEKDLSRTILRREWWQDREGGKRPPFLPSEGFIYFYFYVWILPACMFLHCKHACCQRRPEEDLEMEL